MNENFTLLSINLVGSNLITNKASHFIINPVELEMSNNTKVECITLNKEDNVYEVILSYYIEAREQNTKEKEKRFSATVQYSGLFQISGYDDVTFDKIIKTHCLSILMPYCRAYFSQLINETPFPKLILPLFDPFNLYEIEQKNKLEQQNKNKSEHPNVSENNDNHE